LDGAGEEMMGHRCRSLANTAAVKASIQESAALVEIFLPKFYFVDHA
jgi:hypothetical protein